MLPYLLPYLLILPALGFMLVFIYWPLLDSAYLSTLDWNLISPVRAFVGGHNYAALWADPDFAQALGNTGLYLLALVPIQVVLPLALALLLWPVRRARAQGVYRAVLFTPTVVPFAAGAAVWFFIFDPSEGVLNQALAALGRHGAGWLNDANMALWCVVAVAAWQTLGFNLLLYLAALEAVPPEYVEAAALDGAGAWAALRYVRLPLIAPTIFFVLVTTVIFVNDDVFGAINILTDGGPYGHTTNLLYYLYRQGFRFLQTGEASAVAVLVTVAVMALTWLQFRFIEGRVHYG